VQIESDAWHRLMAAQGLPAKRNEKAAQEFPCAAFEST
jgi:hypothetical protein